MLNNLILNLIVAHIIADFYLQNDYMCEKKVLDNGKGWSLYVHTMIVFVLSWVAVWNANAWWLALILATVHGVIDWLKSYLQIKLKVTIIHHKGKSTEVTEVTDGSNSRHGIWLFLFDQFLHYISIILVAYLWFTYNSSWEQFGWISGMVANHPLLSKTALAMLLALSPANVLLVQILKAYQVKVPTSPSTLTENTGLNADSTSSDTTTTVSSKNAHGNFHSGALIGCVERGLMVTFVIMSQYEALGFLIAAKSILRFSQSTEDEKSEYVLAGTLLSLAIALSLGLLALGLNLHSIL